MKEIVKGNKERIKGNLIINTVVLNERKKERRKEVKNKLWNMRSMNEKNEIEGKEVIDTEPEKRKKYMKQA